MNADPVSAEQKTESTQQSKDDTQLCRLLDCFFDQIHAVAAVCFRNGRQQHNGQGIAQHAGKQDGGKNHTSQNTVNA